MHTNLIRCIKHRFIMITGMFFITSSLLFGAAEAGNNWLEKGTDLLKTYGESSEKSGITIEEIAAGLKDALRVGSENVIARLSRVDGFNTDSAVHIPYIKTDLTDYVVAKGMDGIFYYMAKEEAAIRQDPAKRTTDLLKRVFGAN